MKLSKAESKAVKFVLFMVALSAFARWRSGGEATEVDRSGIVAVSAESTPKTTLDSGPIDPNAATIAELDRLPGIGPTTAAKIIKHRPYSNLKDLDRVIGKKRALQIAGRLTLKEGEREAAPADSPIESGPILLNRATHQELDLLPGVGPSLAARIVAKRDSLGSFRSWEQVDSVSGIGPALLRKLKAGALLN